MKLTHLLAGFLLSTSQLTPFQLPPGETDLRPRYESIVRTLRKKNPDLEIRFVLGDADPKFISVDPKLWDSTGTEAFSERASFGRTLCPGHPRNPSKKNLIVVRADEPGDTLVHEYLHFLQIKADPKLCDLFKRLESQPTPSDLARNDRLEYEVNRFLLERRETFGLNLEAMAGILEKLSRYTKSIPEEIRKADTAYSWPPLNLEEIEKRLLKVLDDHKQALVAKTEYLPPSRFHLATPTVKNTAQNVNGISLLDHPRPKAEDLPICLRIEGNDAHLNATADRAIGQWNEAARSLFKGDLFRTRCDQAKIILDFESGAGKLADGAMRIGEVFDLAPPEQSLILIRGKELQSFDYMLSALIHKALANISDPQLKAIKKKKLAEFQAKQLEARLLNLLLHELGHAIGLGHNFRTDDLSVMNYSESVSLSPYDRAALRQRIRGDLLPNENWDAKITAPQEEGLGD